MKKGSKEKLSTEVIDLMEGGEGCLKKEKDKRGKWEESVWRRSLGFEREAVAATHKLSRAIKTLNHVYPIT